MALGAASFRTFRGGFLVNEGRDLDFSYGWRGGVLLPPNKLFLLEQWIGRHLLNNQRQIKKPCHS